MSERERTGQKYEGILLYTKMISRCSVLLIIKKYGVKNKF